MKFAKPIGPAQIEQPSETNDRANIADNRANITDNRANIAELTRESDTFRQNNNNDELSTDDLGALLRRVTEASTHEIENLMGELHGLRNKLQNDGNRIQSDIAKYTQLSQSILQLATVISDNVKKLPDASGIAQ